MYDREPIKCLLKAGRIFRFKGRQKFPGTRTGMMKA